MIEVLENTELQKKKRPNYQQMYDRQMQTMMDYLRENKF